LRKSSTFFYDNDSTSMFTTVHHIGASTRTIASIPSCSTSEQVGEGGQSGTDGLEKQHLEEEQLDYKPSSIRKKDEEKSLDWDEDVYSLSSLSPPQPSLHKV
jgi:hypothetical protein